MTPGIVRREISRSHLASRRAFEYRQLSDQNQRWVDHADTLSENANMLELLTLHERMTVNASDYHLRLSAVVVAGRPLGRPIIFLIHPPHPHHYRQWGSLTGPEASTDSSEHSIHAGLFDLVVEPALSSAYQSLVGGHDICTLNHTHARPQSAPMQEGKNKIK